MKQSAGFLALALLQFFFFSYFAAAFDPLDPFGNITIRTDVTAWTGDGYEALVTIQNLQRYKHIDSPGWSLGWSWAKKEIIWVIIGAETKNPSDCPNPVAAFNPNSCAPSPQFVDLPPKTPSSLQVPNCCKGGVLSALNAQDPLKSVASFIITVGRSGNSNTSVTLPQHFTLAAPGQKYVCSPAVKIPRTQFSSPDTKRTTFALMTWRVRCFFTTSQS